ncbi:MAG TPA: hypothetical protein VJA94_25670 [Candidatus Angelobacter sp.]
MASIPNNPAGQDTVDDFMKTRPIQEAGLQFLLVEIDTGLTFARIAQAAQANSPRKFERNLQNARKAYDSALRFRRTSVLEPEQKTGVDSKLEQLKIALRELGEEV